MIMGYSPDERQWIAENLNCKFSSFLVTYMGTPISDSRILIKDLEPVTQRVKAKAEPWQGRFTSKASKTVLIDACLSSLPMFLMGVYVLREGIHSSFDRDLSRFFWQAANGRQKYHMVKWVDV